MNRPICFALAAALTSFPTGQAAFAADYDPPIFVEEAPEYVPVEVGSGWYLRGDIGYNTNDSFENDSGSFDPLASYSVDEVPIMGSIGMGYHWSNYFRTELNAGYLSGNEEQSGLNTFGPGAPPLLSTSQNASAENNMWFGLANGYVDLGTYAGFTPYLGGGIGFVASQMEAEASFDNADPTLPDSGSTYSEDDIQLAYTLNAGISYAATKNLSIDLGYQYFNAPDTKYVQVTGPSSFAVGTGVDFHQVKLGLRYDLW